MEDDYCDECASSDCIGHEPCPECNDDICTACAGCACPDSYCPGYPQCSN
jgi:hypothetical protein